jgi:hypothetical protein
MGMFSYTEQGSRRGVGLASFRLYFERHKQQYMAKEGLTNESQISNEVLVELAEQSRLDATEVIDQTLGEYAMFNRPAMWRGDIRQFMFMYKMFPLVSVIILSQLPRRGQLLFLGTLLFLGGMKGLPFYDDIMDLVDMIMQGLGMKPNAFWKGSAERTVIEFFGEIDPDMTPVAMRGLGNYLTFLNISDRVSTANMIPGTELPLAGSDVGRGLMEVLGAPASFLQNSAVTLGNASAYLAETVGIKDDVTSAKKVLRESPFTMFRAWGDMMAYHEAGAIVNAQGKVVSEDLNAAVYIGRLLGVYPAEATKNNDVVKVSKRFSDYQKEMSAAYKARYISAKIAGDRKAMRDTIDMVNDWNRVARESRSGMEIKNFVTNANRSYQEAKRSTAERFRRTMPKSGQQASRNLEILMGL